MPDRHAKEASRTISKPPEYFPILCALARRLMVERDRLEPGQIDNGATSALQTAMTARKQSRRSVLVLGLGNILLGDDGIGIHVVRRLVTDPDTPPGLHPLDGGTLGFRLMDAFASSDATLLIDAAQLGEPAGTLRLLELDALDRHISRGGRVSAHEAGLVDLLTLARLEGCNPAYLALLGIQPQRIDWDETLSLPVARALPDACRMAIDTVLQWQRAA